MSQRPKKQEPALRGSIGASRALRPEGRGGRQRACASCSLRSLHPEAAFLPGAVVMIWSEIIRHELSMMPDDLRTIRFLDLEKDKLALAAADGQVVLRHRYLIGAAELLIRADVDKLGLRILPGIPEVGPVGVEHDLRHKEVRLLPVPVVERESLLGRLYKVRRWPAGPVARPVGRSL